MDNIENKKPKTKRQHYIPVFLLNNFCNKNGQVSVYDKKTSKSYLTTPKEICHEKYLYESKLTDDYFSAPNVLENKFSKMEGRWATLIDRIINICDNKNNMDRLILNSSEKRELAELFFNLFARNPYNMNIFSKTAEQMGWHDTFHLLSEFGVGEDKHICKNFDLHVAFEDGQLKEDFCKELANSYLYVGCSAKEDICISNCPFAVGDSNLLFALLPISPKYAVFWSPTKIREKSNILIPFTPNVAPKIKEHYMKFDAVRFIISKP